MPDILGSLQKLFIDKILNIQFLHKYFKEALNHLMNN